jgi:hypothetical protein
MTYASFTIFRMVNAQQEQPGGFLYNIADDMFGSVINSATFTDYGFVLDAHFLARDENEFALESHDT